MPLGLLARDLNAAGDISDDCLSFVIDVNVFNSNELRSTVFQLAAKAASTSFFGSAPSMKARTAFTLISEIPPPGSRDAF